MKPTLHTIAFKFTINRLRSYIMSDADICDLSSDYRYINLRYVSGWGKALHYQGGTLTLYESVPNISHLANNTKYILHDIAD